MTDKIDRGISPKPKNKSCVNCVYLELGKHPYYGLGYEDGYREEYVWYGENASCYHNIWECEFSAGLVDALSHILEECLNPDGSGKWNYHPLTVEKLKNFFEGSEHSYGLTLIPTATDDFIELATHKCSRFYPKHKKNHRSLEICKQDQEERRRRWAEWKKLWVPTSLSLFAIAISAFSLWTSLK